jgi:hypothetical protein
MKRHPRTAAKLSDSVHQQLSMYALAASAAAVGASALAAPAHARIIYTYANRSIYTHSTVRLDLNHDGVADFIFKDFRYTNSFGSGTGRLSILPAQPKNQIWGHTVAPRAYASALLPGARIGLKKHFLSGAAMMASSRDDQGPRPSLRSSGICTGPWANVSTRYLGLKFLIQGETHFGWARLDVGCQVATSEVTATLTGYAYETVPDRPIITGKKTGPDEIIRAAQQDQSNMGANALQPATLGRLAQGAKGLVAWRREKEDDGS